MVTIGNTQTDNVFKRAAEVLTTSEVTGVFGRTPSGQTGWPLASTFDDNGAQVIEEVSKALQTRVGLISQSDFIVMQRIATFGANTLRLVLGDPDPSTINIKPPTDLDDLIQEAYRWKTALDAFGTETGTAL